MENLSDPQTLYQDILQTAFEKLKKTLPKKYKETHETINTFIDQLKQDKERSANQYFGVFKECIETKDAKLIETSIYYIHKLISHGFLDGNCRDFTQNAEREENRNNAESGQERLLIDSIVESVCSCRSEKNENVQVQLIKVLLTLMTSSTYEVHGASLQEIIHTLFTIHLTSKSSVNQTTAKAALNQIVNAIFKRMEEHHVQSQKNNLKGDSNGIYNFSNASRDAQSRPSIDMSPKPSPLSLNPYPTLSPVTSNASLSTTIGRPQRHSIIGNIETQVEGETTSTPQERYIYRCVEQLVDDVCIYSERVKELEAEYENKDDSEKINLREEIAKLHIQAVPARSEHNDSKYKSLKPVQLENELGEQAGIMGWCFLCRGPANLYCKDTRVPICSVECKARHLDELHYLSNMNKKSDVKEKTAYFDDGQKVLIYLCKLSGKDPANNLDSTALKSKTLSLELLVSIMQNPGPMFLSKPEFKDIVKDHLCDSILKNSVSTDKPVFSYSLGIFISLVKNFRDVLRAEIAVFIEDIFLRMLESGNSSFNHRLLALQVFNKICSEEKSLLEFYVNYDCNMNSTNLVEKVIEILCKIAQGKYARIEYGTIVTGDQETQLRTLALESLVKLVKSLIQYTQECQAKQNEADKLKKLAVTSDEEHETDRDVEDSHIEITKAEAIAKMDDTIEKQRMLKNELQKAIQKFNFKIKNGMKLFIQLGVIDPEDAQSIATFFKHNTATLSKEKLGEYFGDESPFQIKVLTEFTELIDFKGMTIDDGLRIFLNYFDLPGEGQKIDRIMQVFAGKYYKDNPNSFKSGSAAYTLSFALIMLQTDAHSTNIKEQDKMTLVSFSRMVRGINDGEDLSPEELAGFYNRILESPLALHAAAKSKKTQQDARGQNLRRKEEQFRLESEAMIEKGQRLIKQKQEGQYYKVNSPDFIKPLFTEIIWSPLLAVYSVLFEHSENAKMIKLSLEGLCDAIILCGLHKMDTELNAFVSTLSKFTNLTGVREIKDKNLLSIQAMLDLGINNGGMLRMAWRYVLDCMSKINYYSNDYAPIMDITNESEAARRKDAIERHISDTIKNNIDFNKVNYIYSKSSVFSLEEILDFITCLCQISEEELKNPTGPSTYSLQKIVEVAHFNVDRVKFVWTQIWNIMKEHITNAAIHSTKEISFFAVDSLKQLSIKFLIKDELASLEFQKEFLQPFEVIYQQIANDDLKELILNCCNYIIAHVKKNIKSGWKIIIDILGLAAESPKESIVKLSFSTAEKIINSGLDSLKDVFADLAVLLIKFAKSPHEKIAIVALKDLSSLINKQSENKEKLAEVAAQNQTPIPTPTPTPGENKNFSGISDNAWKALLTALSKLCLERKRSMSLQATITLFDIFKTYGEYFPREFWKRIFHEVLKPLFEKSESSLTLVRKSSISGGAGADDSKYENEPLREMFSRLIDIHNYYRPKLDFFTKDLLELLVDCAIQPQEMVAKISLNTIRFLINNWHNNFTPSEWETCIAAFREIFEKTLPRQLLNYKSINSEKKSPREDYNFNSQECLTHCIIQLQMISLVKDVLEQHGDYFNDEQVYEILKMLQASYKFAKSFNEQKYLRFCLWKDDSMRAMDQLPGLVKQEKEALSAYLLLIFDLYNRKLKQGGEKSTHLDDFIELGIDLMKSFYQKNEEYLAIMAHETTKSRESEASPRTADSTSGLSLDEAFKKQTHNIAKQELEREIINIRGIFSQAFLPKLLIIEPSELENKMRELVKNLVNISFYFVPKELVFGEFVKLNSKIYTKQDEASDTIKKLLSAYFEYSINRKKN